jgi:hypothetical protein
MISGNELFLTSSVSYPDIIGWIVVIAISTILLIKTKGEKKYLKTRMLNYASIVIAVLMIIFEVFLR